MRYCNVHRACWITALLIISVLPAHGAEDSKSPQVDFQRDVRSVLKERCFACHGALKQEAGLRLDTAASIKIGGDSGSAISTEKPDQSLLLQKVKSLDTSSRMPPEGSPLSADQIQKIEQWIRSGAATPTDDKPEPSPTDHWAFKLPTRVPLIADNAMHPMLYCCKN
jgi:mono/diheme cytochrome c family protein